ncbi:MAG: site-specific DNA-methyltransferase [Patescibacteria group bacterium]|nr:site-specific DNA-methyltransferase [Patescibacteria group bacterium]
MTDVFTTTDGSIRLVRQDALQFLRSLPSGEADLCLFSPPYNQRRDTKSYGYRARRRDDAWLRKWRRDGYVDDMPEGKYQAWIRAIVAECLRVAAMTVINHKVRGADRFSIHPVTMLHPFRRHFWREVVWDRMGSVSMNSRGHATSHELFLAYRSGRSHWNQREARRMTVWQIRDDADDVWQLSAERTTDHVCAWPVEIPLRFVRAYSPRGGLVVDPFAGRGTTAWACLRTERRFIGSELMPETFRRACKLTQAEWERNEPEIERRQLELVA